MRDKPIRVINGSPRYGANTDATLIMFTKIFRQSISYHVKYVQKLKV